MALLVVCECSTKLRVRLFNPFQFTCLRTKDPQNNSHIKRKCRRAPSMAKLKYQTQISASGVEPKHHVSCKPWCQITELLTNTYSTASCWLYRQRPFPRSWSIAISMVEHSGLGGTLCRRGLIVGIVAAIVFSSRCLKVPHRVSHLQRDRYSDRSHYIWLDS